MILEELRADLFADTRKDRSAGEFAEFRVAGEFGNGMVLEDFLFGLSVLFHARKLV